MKYIIVLSGSLLAAATLHAAEPARPQSEEGPAVVTSPAAAQDPQVGRGNPRRPALSASETAPAATPPASQATSSTPANRGSVDRIELDATQVTGNTELPRVLYVVPWKRAELGEVGGRPARSLLDEVLEPVDRDVFRRQNRYYEALRPDASQAGTKVEN